jgi:hypothetical protein
MSNIILISSQAAVHVNPEQIFSLLRGYDSIVLNGRLISVSVSKEIGMRKEAIRFQYEIVSWRD